MQQDQHLVIVGNGIAGVTLAQQVRLHSQCRITLISSESATHFSRTALMYVYMGHMRYRDIVPFEDWYWRENKLEMLHEHVEKINFQHKQLHLREREPMEYDVLVLATGSRPAFYNWPGQHLKGVQGLVTLQDLELMELNTKGIEKAVVVGGGLIGIEMAEMLRSRHIGVTMLVRDRLFWQSVLPTAEAQLVTNHIQAQGISLLLEDELAEVIADTKGAARAVRTKSGKELPCQFIGIATGVTPNIDFLRETLLELDKGILVNTLFETNIPAVYAIGDCAQFKEPITDGPALEQLWYTARLHAEALGANLAGNRKSYNRGVWFNSAKFLNLEYQVYGFVPNKENDAYNSLY